MFERLMRLHLLFADDGDEGKGGGGGSKNDDLTMTEAIEAAAKEVEKIITVDNDEEEEDDEKPLKKEVKKDKKEDKKDASSDKDEESEDDDEDDDEEEEEELTEEQLFQAKNLHKLLTNPATAEQTLRALAASAGIKLGEADTEKKAEKQAKKIGDLVKEKLGSDYKFLGDKIAAIFEDLLPEIIKEHTKDVREKLRNSEERALLAEVANAQEVVKAEFVKVPDKLLREVLRIQQEEELAPGKNSKPDKFFRACLMQAAENIGFNLIKKQSKSTDTDTKKKDKSPLDTLEESRGSHKEGVKSVQVKSLDDAITAAVETVTASMK